MSLPYVSVVMPTYNAGRFLDGAIRSIRAQTLGDFELILVDDGSTDDSDRVIAEHAAADKRISVLRTPHSGVATALNRGLMLARAKLVARMDADDEAKPERLERQAAALESFRHIAVLGTGIDVIDAAGHVSNTAPPVTDPTEIHRMILLQGNCLNHPTVLMRREVVLAAGGYRPAFTVSEDYDLWLRLSEHHALGNLPDPLLRYRSHAAQASVRHRALLRLQVLAAQHAAHMRRAGRPDPMTGFSRIDTATLRAIGVPRAAILSALDDAPRYLPPSPKEASHIGSLSVR